MTENLTRLTGPRAADQDAFVPDKTDLRRKFVPSGVYAALPTPVSDDHRPDACSLDALLELLIHRGISGLCVGGVTGEYPRHSVDDRIELFRHIAHQVADRVPLVFGIGAEDSRQIRRMADATKDLGAAAVLLPPPAYFRCDPVDLCEMVEQIAQALPLPVLLYHIPKFTEGIDAADTLALARSVGNIVGIKDSSGNRETLQQFAAAKLSSGLILMAGSDELFLPALEASAEGAISGLSCVFPGLMLGIYDAFRQGNRERASAFQSLVEELAAAVNELPTPWGIKILLEAQGFHMGPLSWPLSSRLASRALALGDWFKRWAPFAKEQVSEFSGSVMRRQDSLR